MKYVLAVVIVSLGMSAHAMAPQLPAQSIPLNYKIRPGQSLTVSLNDIITANATLVAVEGPRHGTVDSSAFPEFTYQSQAHYTGTDSFEIVLRAGNQLIIVQVNVQIRAPWTQYGAQP